VGQSLPRLLTRQQIAALRDGDLIKWYRKLKFVRQEGLDGSFSTPKRARWCYHEARREIGRRGLREYETTENVNG